MEPQYNEIGRAGSYTDSPDNIILTSLPSTVFGKNHTLTVIFSMIRGNYQSFYCNYLEHRLYL